MRAARARVRWVMVLVCVSRLAAAEPARRVLLDPGSQASLSRKVRAEASQAGLVVSLLKARSIASDADAAEVLAREPDAAAVVTLMAARKVGIYVPYPPGSGLELLHASADDEDTLPLRIVEHLRARLSTLPAHDEPVASPAPAAAVVAEATSEAPSISEGAKSAASASSAAAPQPAAPKAEPPEASDAVSEGGYTKELLFEPDSGEPAAPSSQAASNDERGFWLEGGGAYSARPGGFESGWRAALGGRYATGSLSLGALVLLPLTTSEFREGESSARAESWSFLVKGAVHDHPVSDLGLSGGPGIGLVVQHLHGAAAPPLKSRDDTVASAALFAHGDVSWALAPWLRIALAVQAGAIVPRIAVRFEGRDVTGTGTWFAEALLVARLRLAPSGGTR